MNKFTKKSLFIAMSLAMLVPAAVCRAEEPEQKKCFTAVEFFTGFGKSKLHAQGNYFLAPFICALDFDIKPKIEKLGAKFFPGLVQFQLEPFISAAYSPRANIEVGNTFMFKLGILPETAKFQPYIKAGIGFLYMSQHTREQSTQFNFEEQGGIGAHYFIKKNFAINADCRIRHVSNSGIDQPNHGINSMFYLVGVTYRFD
ncbi:MAG: acyloxyacyl hydrolase [Candidatus Omnitrophota bacterium]